MKNKFHGFCASLMVATFVFFMVIVVLALIKTA